jgi:hypothetical protein
MPIIAQVETVLEEIDSDVALRQQELAKASRTQRGLKEGMGRTVEPPRGMNRSKDFAPVSRPLLVRTLKFA